MAPKKPSKKSLSRRKSVKGGRLDTPPQQNYHHNDNDFDPDDNLNLEGNPCLRCVLEQTDNPRYEEACQACRNELYNYDMPQTQPETNIPQTQPETNIQQRPSRANIQQRPSRANIPQRPSRANIQQRPSISRANIPQRPSISRANIQQRLPWYDIDANYERPPWYDIDADYEEQTNEDRMRGERLLRYHLNTLLNETRQQRNRNNSQDAGKRKKTLKKKNRKIKKTKLSYKKKKQTRKR